MDIKNLILKGSVKTGVCDIKNSLEFKFETFSAQALNMTSDILFPAVVFVNYFFLMREKE